MWEHVYDKSRTIKNTLKYKYQYSGKIVFWLKNADMVSIAQSVLSVLDRPDQTALPDNIEILKDTPPNKRLLFRIKPSVPSQESLVVKVCKIHLLRLRLKYCWMKYHRYGFAETANLMIASERGIKVPHVYGCGRINGPFGLIEKDIVILEDFNHHISFSELLEQNRKNEGECINILKRAIPVFASHYKAACNNWDINPGSIMFDQQGSELDPIALDFEFIVFHGKSSLEVLMFLAANFAKGFSDWMNREIIDSWVAELLDRVKVEDLGIRERFLGRFDHYMSIPYMTHKERIKIR